MGFFKEVITEMGLSYSENSTIVEMLERNFSIFSEISEHKSEEYKSGEKTEYSPLESSLQNKKFEKDIFTLDLFGSAYDGDAQFVRGN